VRELSTGWDIPLRPVARQPADFADARDAFFRHALAIAMAPDAQKKRLMSTGRHWADLGESTSVAGIWLLYAVYRCCGRVPFRLCLYPAVFYYWLARPRARRASAEYLKRVYRSHGVFAAEPGPRQGLRHFFCFAETLMDKLLAVAGKYPPSRLRFEGHDLLVPDAQSGRGGVIVTAHMGCLELMQVAAGWREDFSITILVHTAHAQRFNRILHRLNPMARVRLLQVADFSPVMVMMLADRVAAGEFVAIAGDRVPVRGGRVAWVPFLGHLAALPTGPYLLASLLECRVYLLSCLHQGNGYVAQVRQLTAHVALPRASRDDALTAYCTQYVAWLEQCLCDSPYDWFNFFPFWNQVPHARNST